MNSKIVLKTEFSDIPLLKRGKVRDIYDLNDHLLIVATDRISAFDVILPNGIPGKGRVLTKISIFWFRQMEDIIENHIVTTVLNDFPKILHKYSDILMERSMIVRKTDPLPVECIVRGYLSGSGWKEYIDRGAICGISLPSGLVESSKLDKPIFTPSTKAEEGHDISITFDRLIGIVGLEMAERIRDISLKIYSKASEIAEKKGIIIADTKFEFGLYNGKLMLIDELITPDSSRFWSMKDYIPGKKQESFDKQIVRDYLLSLKWDRKYSAPFLPNNIVEETAERYNKILKILEQP